MWSDNAPEPDMGNPRIDHLWLSGAEPVYSKQ